MLIQSYELGADPATQEEDEELLTWAESLWTERTRRMRAQAESLKARQEGQDAGWARRCFDEQAARLPRRWRRPNIRHVLRLVVWELPAALGRFTGRLGGAVDETRNWIVGMIIILVFLLALVGFVGREQLIDLLRRVLGG